MNLILNVLNPFQKSVKGCTWFLVTSKDTNLWEFLQWDLTFKICALHCSLMFDCWRFLLRKECGSHRRPSAPRPDGAPKEEADHQIDVSDGIWLVQNKTEAPAAPSGRCLASQSSR
jgi:hypothetical protein